MYASAPSRFTSVYRLTPMLRLPPDRASSLEPPERLSDGRAGHANRACQLRAAPIDALGQQPRPLACTRAGFRWWRSDRRFGRFFGADRAFESSLP